MDPVVKLTPTSSLKGSVRRAELNTDLLAESTVSGAATVRDVYTFFGVPYATPPTGPLRFCPPQPLSLWTGVRDALQFGAPCPQDFSLLKNIPMPMEPPAAGASEDCLFLNVWTPTLDRNAKLPVMFWIHGGGLFFGFGDFPSHIPPNYHDVVVVSINYRLGALGFLCTGDDESSGNYGLLDQIEALRFVQQHIAAFGGDPDNVTIFGVSAGSVSVSLLLLSPLARGLFRRGICESGTCLIPDFLREPKQAGQKLRSILEQMPGAPPSPASSRDILDYMRALPAEALVPLAITQRPVITEPFLPAGKTVYDLLSSAPANPVDLLIGCNSDEGISMFAMAALFVPGITPDKLDAEITKKLIRQTCLDIDEDVERVTEAAFKEYVESNGCKTAGDFHRSLTEFYTDAMFLNGTVLVANAHSRFAKTYLYEFKHPSAFLPAMPNWATADHASEMYHVFGSVFDKDFKPNPGLAVKPDDLAMSSMIMKYWTNFARTGNPNGEGLAEWPQYNESTKQRLVLKLSPETGSNLKQQRLHFWAETLPGFKQILAA